MVCLFLFFVYTTTVSAELYTLDTGPSINFTLTRAFVKNTTSIVSLVPVILSNISTAACLIQFPRVEACQAAENLYGGFVSIADVLCETNNVSLCRNAAVANQPCPLIQSNTSCRNVWCLQNIGIGVTECRNFAPMLPGYQCAPDHYCNSSLSCVDARDDSCLTTISFTIPEPMPPPGNYSLSSSNGVFLESLITLSSGSPRLRPGPLQIISPGAPFFHIIDENINPLLQYEIDDSEIFLKSPEAAGSFVGVLFRYRLDNLTFPPIRVEPAIFAPIPVLFNLCPGTALAYVETNVVMNGRFFYNSTSLACFYGEESVPVAFVSAEVVVCTIFPTNSSDSLLSMRVSNDGVVKSQSASIRILGACDEIKPGSIVIDGECTCPIGTADTGAFCQLCADGFYQSLPGQSACVSCGAAKDTQRFLGATDESYCVCKDGYYELDTPGVCAICRQGMVCVNSTFAVAEGYWRALNSSTMVLECPLAVGGPRCAGGSGSSDDICAKGYKGPLCTVCAAGFGNVGPSRCSECTGKGPDTVVVLLLFLLGCAGIAILVKLTTSMEGQDSKHIGSLGAAIKIFVNYVQLVYYIGTLAARWSPGAIAFFNVFLPMSISPSFISVKCVSEMSFYTRTAIVMSLPILISLALAGMMTFCWIVLPRKWLESNFRINKNSYIMTLIIVLYTVHPMIAASVFSSLNCVEVTGPGGGWYLQADMSIDCQTDQFWRFRAGVGVFIALYVFGAPLFTLWRMWKNYSGIQQVLMFASFADRDPAYRYVYLVRGYKTETFFWEAVVLFRKLAIVGVATLISGGLQMAWCGAILVLSMCLTVQNVPFRTVLDNRLETLAHVALSISVLLAFHSYFLEDGGGGVVLAVLIIVNVLAMSWMIFAAIKRFRKSLFKWSQNILQFFHCTGRGRDQDSTASIAMYQNPMSGGGSGKGGGSDRDKSDFELYFQY